MRAELGRSTGDAGSWRLNILYPASEWRLGALIWAGNYYLLRNDPDSYVPLYRACSDSFPGDPRAATCHWKVAWNAYLRRRDEAGKLLSEHLERFPQSEKCSAALYFLGRLSEESGGRDAARTYYRRILEEYPNNYYAQLALARDGGGITASAAARLSFEPSAESRYRIARSRSLISEGLRDFAETELRFAAREDGQPHVLATELARQANARGAADQGIRYVKAVFPDYLKTQLDNASAEMWRLAFPLPFRQELERNARLRGLDFYLVAGLIRQESEFTPGALSRANAYGLMQVMPATGRQLARQLKLGRFRNSLLHRPDYNLRLGTVFPLSAGSAPRLRGGRSGVLQRREDPGRCLAHLGHLPGARRVRRDDPDHRDAHLRPGRSKQRLDVPPHLRVGATGAAASRQEEGCREEEGVRQVAGTEITACRWCRGLAKYENELHDEQGD